MTRAPSSRWLWFVTLLAAVLGLAACSTGSADPGGGSSDPHPPTGVSSAAQSKVPTTPAPSSPSGPTRAVHVSSLEADGATYGVGMPIILRFSPSPTDSTAFTKAVTVTVNDAPAAGAWYWEKPLADSPIEAHYRTRAYWPADATVKVELPIAGLTAGPGLSYDGKLSSITFKTGDAHISTVNAETKQMTVRSNNRVVRTIPVSLGAAKTPTYNGVKVVMQKGENAPASAKLRPNGAVRMRGPGYDEIVDWSVRVTTSGEYVHAAPWNSQIGQASTSNGCTNLGVADAKWFYGFSLLGDVVAYTGTDGTKMPSWDGYGDWNVNWANWSQGGLLLNH
jgi:lipoprotein-anchoring transpeptidase ErfK/SrfK